MKLRLVLALLLATAAPVIPTASPAHAARSDRPPKPAVFRDGFWYLRSTPTSGVADVVFQYGEPGDIPLFGDWDGNGTKTPGVWRQGVWYLRNSNTSGSGEIVFSYGQLDDVALVGDWDGDGIDTPGVFRAGGWYLRNSNSTGVADNTFSYGVPEDRPIVGDWDGDGVDTPAVGRYVLDPSGAYTSSWFIRNENSTGSADAQLVGCVIDAPVPGAWTDEGHDVCASFQPMYAQWVFGTATPADPRQAFVYGNPNDVALRWN